MTAIIAFFTTTAIGRALAKIGAVVLAVVTFGEYQRREGRKAERAKQAEARAEAVQRGTAGAAEAVTELRKGKTPQEVKDANDARW